MVGQAYSEGVADRVKRSVSMPPEVDGRVAAAAAAAGLTYSAWLARAAERELTIRAGLDAVATWEAQHGAITDAELAAAALRLDQGWTADATGGGMPAA
jgi:hypothetical protein